jgi:hypothetical protein
MIINYRNITLNRRRITLNNSMLRRDTKLCKSVIYHLTIITLQHNGFTNVKFFITNIDTLFTIILGNLRPTQTSLLPTLGVHSIQESQKLFIQHLVLQVRSQFLLKTTVNRLRNTLGGGKNVQRASLCHSGNIRLHMSRVITSLNDTAYYRLISCMYVAL